MKVTIYIENPRQSKTVDIDTELTIGRTPAAQLVVDDEGLSRGPHIGGAPRLARSSRGPHVGEKRAGLSVVQRHGEG